VSDLVIAGCAGHLTDGEVNGREVWTVGRSLYTGASRYYEFHGMSFPSADPARVYTRDIMDSVRRFPVPMTNSICLMLMEAFAEGYKNIEILRSPLTASFEYRTERMSLAACVMFCRGKGARVIWKELDDVTGVHYAKA
jgi:hypothetical protein